MSTESDRDDRPPEGRATGESETVAPGVTDPVAADPPVAGAAAGLAAGAAGVSAPAPTPVIPVSESSFRRPPGTALPAGEPAEPDDLAQRPEVLAGAAFAGGLVFAMLVRRVLN